VESTQGYVLTDDGVRLFFETVGTGAQRVVIPNGFYLVDDFKPLADGRTLIFYDVRKRGRSEAVTDLSKLARGIHNDVDDLEAVRRHFGLDKLNLIGHSYMGPDGDPVCDEVRLSRQPHRSDRPDGPAPGQAVPGAARVRR
jgi:hypothetical protein